MQNPRLWPFLPSGSFAPSMAVLSEGQNTRNVLVLTGIGHFSTHFFELMFPTLAVTLASQAHVPLENSLFAHLTPPRWRATAYGAKFVLTFGVGSLAVWLVRWADSAGGLTFALICLGAVVLSVVVVAALLVRIGEPQPSVVPAAEEFRRRRTVGAALAPAGALATIGTASTERRPSEAGLP